jgi:hypothetical protein
MLLSLHLHHVINFIDQPKQKQKNKLNEIFSSVLNPSIYYPSSKVFSRVFSVFRGPISSVCSVCSVVQLFRGLKRLFHDPWYYR